MGEICRKLGVTEATFYRWKKTYAGLDLGELRELRQLREENRLLKAVVAEGVKAIAQAGGNFQRIIRAGRDIGIDRATGNPTSTYTVITNARNALVTMFPGVP